MTERSALNAKLSGVVRAGERLCGIRAKMIIELMERGVKGAGVRRKPLIASWVRRPETTFLSSSTPELKELVSGSNFPKPPQVSSLKTFVFAFKLNFNNLIRRSEYETKRRFCCVRPPPGHASESWDPRDYTWSYSSEWGAERKARRGSLISSLAKPGTTCSSSSSFNCVTCFACWINATRAAVGRTRDRKTSFSIRYSFQSRDKKRCEAIRSRRMDNFLDENDLETAKEDEICVRFKTSPPFRSDSYR